MSYLDSPYYYSRYYDWGSPAASRYYSPYYSSAYWPRDLAYRPYSYSSWRYSSPYLSGYYGSYLPSYIRYYDPLPSYSYSRYYDYLPSYSRYSRYYDSLPAYRSYGSPYFRPRVYWTVLWADSISIDFEILPVISSANKFWTFKLKICHQGPFQNQMSGCRHQSFWSQINTYEF